MNTKTGELHGIQEGGCGIENCRGRKCNPLAKEKTQEGQKTFTLGQITNEKQTSKEVSFDEFINSIPMTNSFKSLEMTLSDKKIEPKNKLSIIKNELEGNNSLSQKDREDILKTYTDKLREQTPKYVSFERTFGDDLDEPFREDWIQEYHGRMPKGSNTSRNVDYYKNTHGGKVDYYENKKGDWRIKHYNTTLITCVDGDFVLNTERIGSTSDVQLVNTVLNDRLASGVKIKGDYLVDEKTNKKLLIKGTTRINVREWMQDEDN